MWLCVLQGEWFAGGQPWICTLPPSTKGARARLCIRARLAGGEGELTIPLLAKCYPRGASGSRVSAGSSVVGSSGGARRGAALEAIVARLTRLPQKGRDDQGGDALTMEWLQLVASA